MDPCEARALLQIPVGAVQADVERAFRHHVRHAHPDRGGDPAEVHALVQARDVLRRTARRPAPVVVVPDQPWWQPLTRLWPRRRQLGNRRVI